jgi:hypothetical protein
MNTFKAVGIKRAVVAVAGLIAINAFGEYGSSTPAQVSQDITKAGAVLNPTAAALQAGAKGGAATGEAALLKESIAKAEAKVTTNKKELKWRKDNEAVRAENDKLKLVNSLPAILKLNQTKRREEQSAVLRNAIGQLNQTPQSTVNPNDFDTSNSAGQCTSGVDFSQFRALADQMNSQPIRKLRDDMLALSQEKDKKVKDEKAASLAGAIKEAQKLADAEEEDKGQVSVLDANLSDEARIDGLKQDNAALKKKKKGLKSQLVKTLGAFATSAAQVEENDGRLSTIAANFADHIEGFRKAIFEVAMAQAQRLKKNCQDEQNNLNNDGRKAFAKVSEYYQGDVNGAAIKNQYANGLQQMIASAKCNSIVTQVEAALGSTLASATSQFRTANDAPTLVNGAMAAIQTIAAAPGQIGPSVKGLMNQCERVAKNDEKLKKFIQTTDQAIAQDASAQGEGGQGQSRLQGSRGGRGNRGGGAATHRAGQARL